MASPVAKLSLSQLFQVEGVPDKARTKPIAQYDKCCLCGQQIDLVERDSSGGIRRDKDGVPMLSNLGMTAIGETCRQCKAKNLPVFALNQNIRNIKAEEDDITFEILIDNQWRKASFLAENKFAETDENIFQYTYPDGAKNKALIWITRDQLRQLKKSADES